MSDRSTAELCVTCAKDETKWNFVCRGCHRSYCATHSAEHRQELDEQLIKLLEEFENFEKPIDKHQHFLKQIEKWEKDSMKKIQLAADRARRTLEEFVLQSKKRLKETSDVLELKLRQAQRSNSFSEIKLNELKIEVKRFERQVNQRLTAKIIENRDDSIHLIEIKVPNIKSSAVNDQNDRFFEFKGPVDVEEKCLVVTHNGKTEEFGHVRGKRCYSIGRGALRFRLENFQKPYGLFFGFVSAEAKLEERTFKSQEAIGWFSCTETYRHGYCNHNYREHHYNADQMECGDVLTLSFDRELNEVQLVNERINMNSILQVGEQMKYHAWQFLVVLTYPGDSIRILSNKIR